MSSTTPDDTTFSTPSSNEHTEEGALVKISATDAFEVDVPHTPTPQDFFMLNARRSPLLRLPLELLEYIFADICMASHIINWIKLGQICSSLRAALLSFRWLWGASVSDWQDARRRDKILERAGPSVPLTIRASRACSLRHHPGSDPEWVQFAIEHLTRARTLYSSHHTLTTQLVQSANFTFLPFLETVVINSEYTDHEWPNPIPVDAPRLRHVTLSHVGWNFRSPALVTLKIVGHGYCSLYSPSQILALLRKSVRLEELDLGYCLPYIPDALISGAEEPISLPLLRVLEVSDYRDRALQFWRLLSLPSDTKVKFELSDHRPVQLSYTGPPRFEDAGLFIGHLRGRQPVSLFLSGVGHNVSHYRWSHVELAISSSSLANDPETLTRGVETTLQETLKVRYDDAGGNAGGLNSSNATRSALHRICNALNLFGVTHLCWSLSVDAADVDVWTSVLSGFGQLEILEVHSMTEDLCAVLGLSTASSSLTGPNSDSDDASAVPLYVPKLRELLAKGHIRSQWIWEKDLIGMMRSRSLPGYSLERVRLTKWGILSDLDEDDKTSWCDRLCAQFPHCRFEFFVDRR